MTLGRHYEFQRLEKGGRKSSNDWNFFRSSGNGAYFAVRRRFFILVSRRRNTGIVTRVTVRLSASIDFFSYGVPGKQCSTQRLANPCTKAHAARARSMTAGEGAPVSLRQSCTVATSV